VEELGSKGVLQKKVGFTFELNGGNGSVENSKVYPKV